MIEKDKLLKIKSKEKFFLNDKRFYVFYRESSKSEYKLLTNEYFDISSTPVGFELEVKKRGGYVGLSIPKFSDLIVGNQFYKVKSFDNHVYAYNKKNFRHSYEFEGEDFTEIYYPIVHNVVDDELSISVSPTSQEEVVISPYAEYFQDYVRIQTYSHVQNDYVKFFIDCSSNYHLNLNRVSDLKVEKTYRLTGNDSIFSYQDALFNNHDIKGSLTKDEKKVNEKKEKIVKKFNSLFKKIFDRELVLIGESSLFFSGYSDTLPDKIESLIGNDKNITFRKFKTRLFNFLRRVSGINVKDVETYKKDSLVVINSFGIKFSVKVLGLKSEFQNTCKNSQIKYVSPSYELERRVLKYQNLLNKKNSQKKIQSRKHSINNFAWKLKENNVDFEDSLLEYSDKVASFGFGEYFSDDYKDFSFKKFERVKGKVLDDVKKAFVDVRVNEPFFVSVYEDVSAYYFIVLNSILSRTDCRMVVGKNFSKTKWIDFEKNDDTKKELKEFMKHREVFIENSKFGGLLIASKN